MSRELGFNHFSQISPQQLAVIDARGETWTRARLFHLTNRLAHALRANGLRRGDVLALLSTNRPEVLAIHLAANQIGLYIVPLNWHLARAEIAHILVDSQPTAIIVEARLAGVVCEVFALMAVPPSLRISIGPAPEWIEMEDLARPFSSAPVPDAVPGQIMHYTSATTGRPKGVKVALPDSYAEQQMRAPLFVSCGIAHEDGNVHLCASMLYHRAPLDLALLALHMGHPVVLMSRADPEHLLQLIEKHQVTTAFMPPATFVRLLKLPDSTRDRYSTASLRWVNHAGAPCPRDVKQRMIDWWGLVLWEDYGSSETGSITLCSSSEWLEFPGTVGRPMAGTILRVLDEDGRELPCGQIGQIYIERAGSKRFEYKGDLEKTRAAYRGDFCTVGDMGYLNEAGYLFLTDRSIDMIVSGGTKIYCAEVEQTLILHPQVADCAVFGIPDELLGESVKAVIQPTSGAEAGPQLTHDILRFMAERLAMFKLPRRIEYRTELPRDPNGKLFKERLRMGAPAT